MPSSDTDCILVTGASTGTGLSLSKRLIKMGYRLVLTARESSLRRFETHGIFKSEHVWLRALDVTSDDQRRELVKEINRRWGGVDILVNNAGVGYRSVVEHVSESERLMQMNINFRSPMELSRLVLPGMRAKRRGRIINISSVGGMMAMPTMAVYSASKFALEGASEALWYEVRPWGVYVTLVEPGFINSLSYQNVPFTKLALASLADPNDPYHAHYVHMREFIERSMRFTISTSDTVAKTVVRAVKMRRPPLRMAATADAWLFALMRRLLPQRIYCTLLYHGLPKLRLWGPKDRRSGSKR